MRLVCLALVAALSIVAVACGGDGGDEDAPDATATFAAPFDPALLTAAVLNKNDLPEGFDVAGQFNPGDPDAAGRSFTSFFVGPTLRIQSTVVHYNDATTATQDFQRNRRVLPAFGAREENADVAGAQIAFLYRVPTPPGSAIWGIVDNYVVFVQLAPTDPQNPDPAAVDVERLRGLTETVFARVRQLIDDPASVTPVPLEEFNAPASGLTPATGATPAPSP